MSAWVAGLAVLMVSPRRNVLPRNLLFDDNYFSPPATIRIPRLHPSLTLLSQVVPAFFFWAIASLLLFLECVPITVSPPGETELGSAGTQPNKG